MLVRTDGLDEAVHRFFLDVRVAGLTDFFRAVTHLGGSLEVNVVVLIVVVGVATWQGSLRRAAVVLAALIVGELARSALNHVIARPRPPRADWLTNAPAFSMPSGHSSNVVLGTGLIAVMLWPLISRRPIRLLLIRWAVLAALLVGTSRLYLGVHWLTDVLAGWAYGLAVVLLASWLAARVDPVVS